MSEILLYYKRPDPTTWVYLSSFLTIGLYFVFHRFWSIRNLDIILLILLAPGLLVVYEGRRRQLRESEIVVRQQAEQVEEDAAEKIRQDALDVDALDVEASGVQSSDVETGDIETGDIETGDIEAEFNGLETRRGQMIDPGGFEMQGERLRKSAASKLVVLQDGSSGVDVPIEDGGGEEAGDSREGGTAGVPSQLEGLLNETDGGDTESFSNGGLAVGNDDELVDPLVDGGIDLSAGGYSPTEIQRWGFIYLFVIEAFILLRLMLDPLMVRRPLLDPNLTTGGLNFIGISLFIFMMANVIDSSPRIQVEQGPALGPGYSVMNMLPAIPTRPVSDSLGGALPPTNAQLTASQTQLARIAKTVAILAQLAIVAGIVLIANRHFGNLRAGVGCATLYLMLPYTAQMTGRVDHALPAALLLWAVLSYRRPMIAGTFLGLAGGLVYYPLFLLPLWFSFYWQRGAKSFAIGVVAMLAVLTLALSFDSSASLTEHLQRMFGLLNPNRAPHELRGIWALGWNPIWRLPVIVAFVILSVLFASWPAQKNLGTLLSGTAAVMVAAQFWHGYGGGLYIAWFLPLLLLTIFRPNLQDRVSTKVVLTRGTERLRPRQELETV